MRLPAGQIAVRVILRQVKVLRLELQLSLRLGKRLIRPRRLVALGVLEARIALAKLRIGDIRIDVVFEQIPRIRFAGVARIGVQLRLLEIPG